MITLLRKHRQWLMIVIVILALPFCIYFVKTDYSAIRPDDFGRIYNRKISLVEARRDARLFDLAQALGMSSFRQDLSAGAKSEADAYVPFILNLVILRHEAARLGIWPTAPEIADVVRKLEAFRGPSGFDLQKYNNFTQNFLAPNGLGEEQIEQLVRDELCLNRIKQLVAAGASLPESESKANYDEAYGKLFVSVIRLRSSDFAKDIKVTDDDVRKYYEAHKAEFKSEEKRKIEFVSLAFTDEQKKLSGKERIDALQKLADRANDFTQALLEKGADFKQVAAKFQRPVRVTGEFTAAAPDPQLNVDPQLGAAAFGLTVQEPNSDPLQAGDGFYILHLAGMAEARPLTVEEAKPKVLEAIKSSRTKELISTKGAEIAHQLREATASGQPVEAAIQKTGLKAEKIPPFSLAEDSTAKPEERNEPPDLVAIKNAVAQINPGDVSDFFPWEEGGLIAALEKREPADPAKYPEKKAAFDSRYREIVFYEWLRDRQRDAGLQASRG
jgi:parvulin-like peptidyl-prolyl cis-trans isomerase-like protein/SurA-like protein